MNQRVNNSCYEVAEHEASWEPLVRTRIVNVVATANLNQEVDLYELARYREIIYDQEIYGGRVAYFRIPGMEGKVSIFPSGKMISIGTKSEREAFAELELTRKYLSDKGMIADSPYLLPKVHNIVVAGEFGKTVNLEKLSENQKMIYEPDQFPGGILRIEKPFKATILVFASGKIVVTGLKSSDQINPILQKLEKLLKVSSPA